LIAINDTWIDYPTEVDDLQDARLSVIAASLGLFVLTGGGLIRVIRYLSACRANLRAIRRSLLDETPLSEIHEACVREKRAPTPEEHARVLRQLMDAVADVNSTAPAQAHDAATERQRAIAERLTTESRLVRAAIEHIDFEIELAHKRRLRARIDTRIREIVSTMETQQ
jgi:hypothetical protein